MKIRFGLRYDPDAPDRDPARTYAAVLVHALEAEARGADLVWLSERALAPGAPIQAAFPLAAAVAARTTQLRIGAGPFALPLWHPLRLAEDAAVVDGLSGGRLELGAGLGDQAEGFDGFGVEPRERVQRFEAAIATLRAAWRDEPVERGEGAPVEVLPKPVQRPGVPLWIGARADTAVRRAARLGDGLLCAGPGSAAAPFLDAWREAGRPEGEARVAFELPLAPGAEELARAAQEVLDAARGFGAVDLLLPAFPRGLPPETSLRRLDLLIRLAIK